MRKTDSITLGLALRRNYFQLIFVFLAFAMMVLAAYFFIGRILRERLLSRTNEMIYTAEANVRAGLSEAETTLLNSYYIVQGMIERDAGRQEIFDYLTGTTEWMRRRDQGLLGFYGIYGYINGELYDSIGINPAADYIPQRQLWYQTAVRSGNNVAYTAPYEDYRSGDIIVSAVRNIDINNGDIAGILAVDININWLVEYVGSLKLTPDGYSMLLSQNMTIMAHQDSTFLGHQLQELGGPYEEIARTLRGGGDVFALRRMDTSGRSVITFFTRIFNGWYVGIVTPHLEFYWDLYLSATFLILLGLFLALSLCYILLRFSMAKIRSDEDSKSKSSFLAKMSHEIRTPMNAITGMAEIALREDMSNTVREHIFTIKQAGANLLSIINDILDFSKIESGKLEIVPSDYLFSSLINDVVSIIRMKVIDSQVRFVVNIDCNIPNELIGDEIRVRQVFLNILSNAVKYTEKGYVSLSVTGETSVNTAYHDKPYRDTLNLTIKVTDSGRGIKQEDIEKLFGDFVQIDLASNKGIEGTGLGLAITQSLVNAMGGKISVISEYGVGSTFTITLPQIIRDHAKLASVKNPSEKRVLVYERREVYSNSIVCTINNLGVDCTSVATSSEFSEELESGAYVFVFIAANLYEKVRDICTEFESKSRIILLTGFGEAVADKNLKILAMPAHSISVANVLNDEADGFSYSENIGSVARFTAPDASIVIVDDIETNLMVTRGLLSPFEMQITLCKSGLEAIEAVSGAMNNGKQYDLILMDHMMPEMDGVQATKRIRALEKEQEKTDSVSFTEGETQRHLRKQMPIIALTANAIAGTKEMFLENGFNDFLSKPIDTTKLNTMIEKWIPKEKQKTFVLKNDALDSTTDKAASSGQERKISQNMKIEGLDVKKGIAMTGGTEAGYRSVLSQFRKDAEERLPLLQTAPKAASPSAAADDGEDTNTLSHFITQVHGLKSASAFIGAVEISAMAAELEAAGNIKDMAFIETHLPAFTERLVELIDKIQKWETNYVSVKAENTASKTIPLQITLLPLLRGLLTALESQDAEEIDRILKELDLQPQNQQTKDVLEKTSDDILMSEFDNAIKNVKDLLVSLEEGK